MVPWIHQLHLLGIVVMLKPLVDARIWGHKQRRVVRPFIKGEVCTACIAGSGFKESIGQI